MYSSPDARFDQAEITLSQEEEERRLFYVAITRARKKLFLTWSQIRTIFGSQRVNERSEFIDDIEDDILEVRSVQNDGEEPRGIKAIFIDF